MTKKKAVPAKKKAAKKKAARKKTNPPTQANQPLDSGDVEFDMVEYVVSLGLKPDDYTTREILLCFGYVSHFNATKAYKAAGYGVQDKYASRAAYRAVRRPHCVALINALKNERFQRLQMETEDILAEWAAIARFDGRNLYDENGSLLQPHELDDDTAKCVVGLKVRKEFEGQGAERAHVADILEYKIIDKHTALTNLARNKSMFKDTTIIEPGEELSRLLDAIDGKTTGPPGQRGKG